MTGGARDVVALTTSLALTACSLVDDAGSYAVESDGDYEGGSNAAYSPDALAWIAATYGECSGSYCPVACSGPSCPVVLATGEASATFAGLAVDGTSVYWTDGATIWKCSVTGCGNQPTVIVTGQTDGGTGNISSMAVDGTNVYWTTDWSATSPAPILVCPAAGCREQAPRVFAHGVHAAFGAVDGKNVFWTDANGAESCPVSGCSAPTLLAPGAPYFFGSIAMDDTDLYWTTSSYDDDGGTVLTCPKVGCNLSPKVLATGLTGRPQLAVNRLGIYWLTFRGVTTCPRANFSVPGGCGDASTVLASDLPLSPAYSWAIQSGEVATDNTSAYATIGLSGADYWGAVLKCSADGRCSTLASVAPGDVGSITVDATHVYWSAVVYGSKVGAGAPTIIMKAAK